MSGALPAVSLEPGERILVTRLDYLGDVILSLALIDALRERWPGVEIDYLARRPGADVLAPDHRFSRVFAIGRKPGVSETMRLVRELRSRHYRAVIDLYSNPRSAWLTWLTGAPVRVGGERRGRRHLYTHPVKVPAGIRSALAHHLEQARPLGVDASHQRKPVFAPSPDAMAKARQRLADAGVDPDARIVGIHPGGKWPVKRWPAASFAALAGRVSETGATVAVLTGPGEEMHTTAVAAGAVHTLPAMPVADVAAVIASFSGMVACDGGIMHLSVAVGTPTVGVFGSAEPDVWFPYEGMGPFRAAFEPMDCRPCHQHECPLGHTNCLTELSPDAVFALLGDVMGRASHAGESGERT